jgi:predicted Zn-dependent protease with MMP-like domain
MYHNDRLGLEEYRTHVLENISMIVINPNYVQENIDFFNKIIFKMFQDYDSSVLEPISINKQIKLLNIFLSVMLSERPSLELPPDTVNID